MRKKSPRANDINKDLLDGIRKRFNSMRLECRGQDDFDDMGSPDRGDFFDLHSDDNHGDVWKSIK